MLYDKPRYFDFGQEADGRQVTCQGRYTSDCKLSYDPSLELADPSQFNVAQHQFM